MKQAVLELVDGQTRTFAKRYINVKNSRANGLCLLDRTEQKFGCNEKVTAKLKEKLLNDGFKQEKFFGIYPSERICTMVVLNNDPVNFTKYSRPRIRSYYIKSMNEITNIWLELRIRDGEKVIKTRKKYNREDLSKILTKLSKKGYNVLGFMNYKREAFENKKNHIRITIDSDITYFNKPAKEGVFKQGEYLHTETFCTVKFKTIEKIDLDYYKKGLTKPHSKLQGLLKALKKVKK